MTVKSKQKRKPVVAADYNKLIDSSDLHQSLLELLKKEFKFPIKSLLEIGTGTGTYLTKFLIEKERAKDIEKFYGMEPVEEFFEESKRVVVRLSRTDATLHEYYGGNPFDVITSAFVFNHITPDKKQKFLSNIHNNLSENGQLIILDSFIQNYSNEDERKVNIKQYIDAKIDYYVKSSNKDLAKHFEAALSSEGDDFIMGNYKVSLESMVDNLEKAGFKNIKTTQFKGKKGHDWDKMRFYIVSAEK